MSMDWLCIRRWFSTIWGSHIQSSGIFIGTAPAPDLANDFAFMHELKFLEVMIDEYVHAINSGNGPLYPYAFI